MIVHSPKLLALFIRDFRKEHQLSQTKISELSGIKQSTLSAFENHPESTKLETLFRILSAVNCELHIRPKNDDTPINDTNQWDEEW